jgi:hypothetical protein
MARSNSDSWDHYQARRGTASPKERSASNMRSSIASANLRAANRHTNDAFGRALFSGPVGLGGMAVSLYGTARETAHGHFAQASGHLADAFVLKPLATVGMMTGGTLSACKDVTVQLCKSAWHAANKLTDGAKLRKMRASRPDETIEERRDRRIGQAKTAKIKNQKSAHEADLSRGNTKAMFQSMLSTERFPSALRQNLAAKKQTLSTTSLHQSDSLPATTPLVSEVHSG